MADIIYANANILIQECTFAYMKTAIKVDYATTFMAVFLVKVASGNFN